MSMERQPGTPRRSPGRPKREDQAPAVRERILHAASALFMEQGYKPVSMQQVAHAAGVTKASVYYYYPGKSDLFTASIVQMMERIRASVARMLAEPGSLREQLERIAEAKLDHAHIEFEAMMRDASFSLSPEKRERIRGAESAIHEELAEHFAKVMEAGETAVSDPLLMALAFASLLMLGNRREELRPDAAGRTLAAQIVDLFWRGAAPRTGGTAADGESPPESPLRPEGVRNSRE